VVFKVRYLELKDLIEECGKEANKKGWKVDWKSFPIYMALTAHEVLDSVDKGWRNDDRKKAMEEIGDTLIRLFHIIHDMNFPIEDELRRIMRNNKRREFRHGKKIL